MPQITDGGILQNYTGKDLGGRGLWSLQGQRACINILETNQLFMKTKRIVHVPIQYNKLNVWEAHILILFVV